MTFTKRTTLTIPDSPTQWIGDWLISRYLEQFGSDKLIMEFISSWLMQFNKIEYTILATGEQHDGELKWVISVSDYQEFLDGLRAKLPKKFRKKGSVGKPWFDNVIPIVDLGMWPFTFEAAAKLKEELELAKLK